MKKVLFGLVSALTVTQLYAAETSGTISFTNDYRFNGISQTAGDAAVQGSLDVAFDNGIYAGIWGSNVDFGDDANLEIDYYVGYGNSLTDDLSYDVNLAWYSYPGYDAYDGDYGQLNMSLYYGNASLSYGYADDYFNTGESGQYIAVAYSQPLPKGISLDLHAGHSFGDYWGKADIEDYEDYSIGLSGSVAGLDLSAAYIFNSIDKAEETNSGLFRNDNTLVVTVSRTF
ncbi:TorF family putative porin [Marinobacterium sp. YM272]|uniref:TorF family putative porin n=1 Tax=Marinobacterium sp. YM272 TaxID=3421654 RepID=UPI003D7FEDAE